MHRIAFWVLLTTMLICAVPVGAADAPYIGIQMQSSQEPPGLLVDVVAGSPADKAGLRTGDVIQAIEGQKLSGDNKADQDLLQAAIATKKVGDPLKLDVFRPGPRIALTVNDEPIVTQYPVKELAQAVYGGKPGDVVKFESVNQDQTLAVTVILGPRPEQVVREIPPNSELNLGVAQGMPLVRSLCDKLVDETKTRAQYEDLKSRLNARATPDDGYRLRRVTYLLRDGFQGEVVTRSLSEALQAGARRGISGYTDIQLTAAQALDLEGLTAFPRLRTGLSAEQHLTQLEEVLTFAAQHVKAAFAEFTPEELQFVSDQRDDLTEVYRRENYVHVDEDPERRAGNLRLIELAAKIKYRELMLAQLELAGIADESYLTGLKADLEAEFAAKLGEPELMVRETPLGKMIIQGTGHTWRQPAKDQHEALIIDLGGDDFYTNSAGAGVSAQFPVGVLIEFGGNDAYESSTHYSQGSGSLGCGLLIDLAGDDEYVGLQWAQGTGFMGCGALIDAAGDDIYRGQEFTQSAAIFGTGILLELEGNDRFEAHAKSQSFGGAHAVSFLVDRAGDDYRYCNGLYPTNYGDPGIFDSWSQGCADGFRSYASGGIAGIVDMGGSDYTESGNFSTGGGYYFGYGFYHDSAQSDDRYVGSRYNQGFCAHQAVGVFLEDGGNDLYQTRQSVAQGLAWDECCTVFIDAAGDDRYEGGGGFSQGASAHNAVCLMWDKGGKDTYVYPAGQARAGGNDYHGGTSLSLFIDEGGAEDSYDSPNSANNLITGWPEYGFFCDLPGSLSDALKADAWRSIWKSPDFLKPTD
jgi:hypothetical protein